MILELALLAALQDEPAGFGSMWADYGPRLEADGISRPMFKVAMIWTEGQYQLGRCRAHLADDEVTFWRQWWDNTPLPQSELGRMILASGSASYTQGLEESAVEPLTADHCRRIAVSWSADMRAAVSEVE